MGGSNNQVVTPNAPAQAGEAMVMYGTGIGIPMCPLQTGAQSEPNCLANVVPQITFPDYPSLNSSATLLYAGLTPGGVGLAQFNIQLPPTIPSAALAAGSIRMRIGDPTVGQTFSLYLPGSSGTSGACAAFPSGFVPFSSVDYLSEPDSA